MEGGSVCVLIAIETSQNNPHLSFSVHNRSFHAPTVCTLHLMEFFVGVSMWHYYTAAINTYNLI